MESCLHSRCGGRLKRSGILPERGGGQASMDDGGFRCSRGN
ncbi:hypothetical protein [Deinococcus misasensis]|nr:hypothetical protein [Deinococcus misasensis]